MGLSDVVNKGVATLVSGSDDDMDGYCIKGNGRLGGSCGMRSWVLLTFFFFSNMIQRSFRLHMNFLLFTLVVSRLHFHFPP